MDLSTDTIRRMVSEAYRDYLSEEEIERLLPYVVSHFEAMKRLHALDLGEGDPRSTHYVRDHRLMR